MNYTEGTVSDDIHQEFIREDKGFGPLGQIVAIVAAVALAVATAGTAAAALAGTQLAAAEAGMAALIATGSVAEATAAGGILASSVFAAGGMANLAIAGAIGSIASSAAIQLGMTGKIKLDKLATAGIAGAVTGGLTGYFGSNYGVERLLTSGAAGCGTATMQGGDCKSGAMTGFATAAIAWAADAMRQDQVESSRRFKGIYDTQDDSGVLDDSDEAAETQVTQMVEDPMRLIDFRVELLHMNGRYQGQKATVSRIALDRSINAKDEVLDSIAFDPSTKSFSHKILNPEPGYAYKLAWPRNAVGAAKRTQKKAGQPWKP